MKSFFSRLSYSFGNEDWDSDLRALSILPSDRIFCITASGDRPLHLLMNHCNQIVTLDANPIQNHLLELKIAAMKSLDCKSYQAFLGITESPSSRFEILTNIHSNMSPAASQYWLQQKKAITSGIIYQGSIEKRMRFLATFLCSMRGKMVDRLFSFDDLELQKQFVQKEWQSKWWRKIISVMLSPKSSKLFLADPGLYTYRDPSINAGTYLYDRLTHGLTHHLAKENTLLSLFLKGEVNQEALPPYLTESGFAKIKQQLGKIQPVTQDVLTYLENAPENSFDCFSLSDVASYLNADQFRRLIMAVYRTAKPGARFCLREFLSKHHFPDGLKPLFCRNPKLEKQLEEEDRCFIYRFMVGHIIKTD